MAFPGYPVYIEHAAQSLGIPTDSPQVRDAGQIRAVHTAAHLALQYQGHPAPGADTLSRIQQLAESLEIARDAVLAMLAEIAPASSRPASEE